MASEDLHQSLSMASGRRWGTFESAVDCTSLGQHGSRRHRASPGRRASGCTSQGLHGSQRRRPSPGRRASGYASPGLHGSRRHRAQLDLAGLHGGRRRRASPGQLTDAAREAGRVAGRRSLVRRASTSVGRLVARKIWEPKCRPTIYFRSCLNLGRSYRT